MDLQPKKKPNKKTPAPSKPREKPTSFNLSFTALITGDHQGGEPPLITRNTSERRHRFNFAEELKSQDKKNQKHQQERTDSESQRKPPTL